MGVGENVPLASVDLLARVVVVALRTHGVGALQTQAVDDRSAVLKRSHRLLLVQRWKASCTVVREGYSFGSMRHWQPVLSR